MNYAGFTKPAWTWLAQPASTLQFLGQPLEVPLQPARAVRSSMGHFLAQVPWRVATHHFNLLCSHDTPRFRTVTADRGRSEVGAALLFSFPGIPMVFAGDEIGLTGANGEGSRTPFPWDRSGSWDHATLRTYKDLIALRKSSPALRAGGLRWVYSDDDAMVYLREAPGERMLVLLARGPGGEIVLDEGCVGLSGEAANCYGGAEIRTSNGKLTLPGEGPMAQIWRLS